MSLVAQIKVAQIKIVNREEVSSTKLRKLYAMESSRP